VKEQPQETDAVPFGAADKCVRNRAVSSDGRIWLMETMRNARLSAGVVRIKTPPPPTILKRRLNMKAILLVAGMVALLASPAAAQQGRPQNATPNIPKDARASVAPYGTNEGGPYTPSAPTPPHGTNRDFQNGSKD
jgi:hypothetical protein